MFTVSCPNCAATYQLDEAKVGPAGRKLKCAKCGHIWVAFAPVAGVPAEAAAEVEAAPVASAEEGGVDSFIARQLAEDEGEAAAPGGGEEEAPGREEVGVGHAARVGRFPLLRKVAGERKWTALGVLFFVAGLVAGGWVLLGGGHGEEYDVFSVTRLAARVPAAREVMPAPEGVALSDLDAHFVTDDREGVVFSVTGKVRNDSSQTVVLPSLEVELLDATGKVTDVWPATIETPTLAPTGESRWAVKFSNPDVRGMSGWRAVFVK